MEKFTNNEKHESGPEKGANVELVLHIMRHGDRHVDGSLEDFGRARTKERAQDSHLRGTDFDAVKAFGSTAGPKAEVLGEELAMQRSLETAHIFTKELVGDEAHKTRPRSVLNYETLKLQPPFDYLQVHTDYVDAYIKEELGYSAKSFDDLTGEEKAKASSYADAETVGYLANLETDAAQEVKKEVVGSFSVLIERYIKMAKEKLKSNQKLLFPIGSHTGMVEPFLSEVVIWINEKGEEQHGATYQEMGGNFKATEGFDIILKTDDSGELEEVRLRFDDANRFGGEARLDMEKVREGADFYRELHKGELSS